jgi:hypothetical protein
MNSSTANLNEVVRLLLLLNFFEADLLPALLVVAECANEDPGATGKQEEDGCEEEAVVVTESRNGGR